MKRPVQAHFLGGPLDGEVKVIECIPEYRVPLQDKTLAAVAISEAFEPLDPVAPEVGVYVLDQRYRASVPYDHVIYLYSGTEADLAQQRKDRRRRRLLKAFDDACGAQFKHERSAYWQAEDALREVRSILEEALP